MCTTDKSWMFRDRPLLFKTVHTAHQASALVSGILVIQSPHEWKYHHARFKGHTSKAYSSDPRCTWPVILRRLNCSLYMLQDSKFGGNVRSGSNYYDKWDEYAKAEGQKEEEPAETAPPSSKASVADVIRAAAAGSSSSSVSGPARTAQQLQSSMQLSEQERTWNSEQERMKGNECFRCAKGIARKGRQPIAKQVAGWETHYSGCCTTLFSE